MSKRDVLVAGVAPDTWGSASFRSCWLMVTRPGAGSGVVRGPWARRRRCRGRGPVDPVSYAAAVEPGYTVVHLVGTPTPSKAAEFAHVDMPSIRAAVAAVERHAAHLVDVSVTRPAHQKERRS